MVPLAVADVFSAGHQPPWPRKPDDISAQNKHSKKWKIPMFLPCQQLDEDWLCTSSTAPIHIVDFHNKKKNNLTLKQVSCWQSGNWKLLKARTKREVGERRWNGAELGTEKTRTRRSIAVWFDMFIRKGNHNIYIWINRNFIS